MNFKLPKREKLCHQKRIDELFSNPDLVFAPPLKIHWKIYDRNAYFQAPVQFFIAVPKRIIKKAVHRNYARRVIRESYRLNHTLLYNYVDSLQKELHLAIILTNKSDVNFTALDKAVKIACEKLQRAIQKKYASSNI